jgi:glc operon protein GlcG
MAGANVFTEAKASESTPANKPSVLFFDAKQVSTSFSTGAALLESNDRNYMVHTSRRDKPGLAEVHTLDTDIIYVMEGTATIVTGGTAVDAKEIAPNEIRGSRIEGGVTRQLSKGQVIIVPNNTAHWFKEVNGEFLYYTIKVR